jgi:hypothetical protein
MVPPSERISVGQNGTESISGRRFKNGGCGIEGTLPNGISRVTPTVNHCPAHGAWSHAIDRRSNNTPLLTTAYFRLPVAPYQNAEMTRPRQVPFRFAPTTGGPLAIEAQANERARQKS